MEIEIVIAVLILLVMVFLATIDMAFSQLSDVSLRRLSTEAEENPKSRLNKFLQEILRNRPRFRFALSATIQILLIIFSVLVTLIVWRYLELTAVALLVCLGAAFIFRQFIPRLITWKNPEAKLLILLPIVSPFYAFMSLLADPFQFFVKNKTDHENYINLSEKTEEKDEEELAENMQALMEVAEAEGIIEEEDRELFESVFEFGETRAGEIMTPRTEICALPLDSTVKEARDLIIEEKYSRIPVYDGKIDDIKGILFMRDLLSSWAEGKENYPIKTLLRPVYEIPETKLVDDLLEEMQKNHVQLAVVIDEYGGVAGLVTVEDILEEIVGEIEDEDTEQEEVIEIVEGDGGNYFDVIGSTEIGKVERLFDLEIEDDDFTTLAGLVISEVGYVPKKGESFDFRGLHVEILKADDKKIHLLRLKKEQTTEEEETEKGS